MDLVFKTYVLILASSFKALLLSVLFMALLIISSKAVHYLASIYNLYYLMLKRKDFMMGMGRQLC